MIAATEATYLAEASTVHGDELVSAFDTVRDPLLNTLHSMLGSREDAEDALQTAFVRCWQTRAAVPQIRNLRGWVWRISLNVGRDLLDYSRRRRSKSLSCVESTAICPAVSPLDALTVQEDENRLDSALDSLRTEEREIFLLRQKKFLTYGQIAQLRDSPVGSIKTLMHGAVQKLRGILHENN
jgi:RNA polymerase sigma-70 factor, ECF subfamily